MRRKMTAREAVGIKAQSRWPNHKRAYRLHSSSPPSSPPPLSPFFHLLLFDVLLINQPHSYSLTGCVALPIFWSSQWLSTACFNKNMIMWRWKKLFCKIRLVFKKLNGSLRQREVFFFGHLMKSEESTTIHTTHNIKTINSIILCVWGGEYLRWLIGYKNPLPLSRPEDNLK